MADVIVLGARMVGASPLHPQQRGCDVVLVDKHELAGEETAPSGLNGLVDHIGGMAGAGIPARRQLACTSEPAGMILPKGHYSAVRIEHEG